ncbi:MAG: homoserine dehydrogenase [Chloroflexota bacterium]|nr:homoserine dehydrogenase [Chloroflexota bacterium]
MKQLRVIQVGYGTVGGAVLEQIADHRAAWRARLELDVFVVAFGGRAGAICVDIENGIDDDECRERVRQRRDGVDDDSAHSEWEAVISASVAQGPTIVMDAAAGEETASLDVAALEQGAGVVLSNKAPLALPLDDPRSAVLWAEARSDGRLRYEATVGAGLPVISMLHTLLDSSDEMLEITGMLSGTFGAIFSDVSSGTPFSEAVRTAKEAGFTEPDPRDDLSGLDVARKALILARTTGHQLDLTGIDVRSFVPDDLAEGSIDEFLDGLDRMNDEIDTMASDARAGGGVMKYVASVDARGAVTVKLQSVSKGTVMGALTGPENVVSFRTERYDQYPTVVSGPGAGAAVTAAGMIGDMLRLGQSLGQEDFRR